MYDYKMLNAWLSHPVKRYKGQDNKQPNPKRPMYRRRSQSSLFSPVDILEPPPIIKAGHLYKFRGLSEG